MGEPFGSIWPPRREHLGNLWETPGPAGPGQLLGSLMAHWEASGKAWEPLGALWAALEAFRFLPRSLWGASGATAASTGRDLGSFWETSGRFRKPLGAFELIGASFSGHGEPLGILVLAPGKPGEFP